MAKVELIYNPYLLDTKVTFNGNEPRINSLIEKYQEGSLYKWINDMPRIFHDEMNGYDFELDFSGSEKDCEAVKKVFEAAAGDSVKIFFKKKIGSRKDKEKAISDLLNWFEANHNRRFDFAEFKKDNEELLDNHYSIRVINGETLDESCLAGLNVSIDRIDDVEMIKGTDFALDPILVCINSQSLYIFEDEIQALFDKNDVKSEQIFFLINPLLDKQRIERYIKDLGILTPQIIEGDDLSLIANYIELYPLTDYIREVINVLKDERSSLESDLDNSMTTGKNEEKNKMEAVDNVNRGIENLKLAQDTLEARDNIDIPEDCIKERKALQESINNWRKRKTKITKDDDALRYASEYEESVLNNFNVFMDEIDFQFFKEKDRILNEYLSVYRKAGFDTDYVPGIETDLTVSRENDFNIKNMLVTMKHEREICRKENYDYVFSIPDKESFTEVIYFNHEWREAVEKVVIPRSKVYISDKYDALCEVEKQYAENLINHLGGLIVHEKEKKQSITEDLSEMNKELQKDAEWLTQFSDTLENIMRG